MLHKKILLGITGSIAAYKSITLVRLLVKAGAEVKVVCTPSAKSFVSPLVLSTLSKNTVFSELFEEETWANHVALGRWADAMLIAPLSCNTLSKMATGACDNLLLATYLSATCPVIVAPAMDEDMWHHPATKKNLETIQSFGNKFINVNKGELASGLLGEGRMAEPEDIFQYLETFFSASQRLAGKKVLITAGPTHEPLDPVRFVANHSSGKMGFALAKVYAEEGADVTLVAGPVSLQPPAGVTFIPVVTAAQMYEACISRFEDQDMAILSAAVADYTPAITAPEKIKKDSGELIISLTKTKDILRSLGERKRGNQVLIGFALETHNEKEFAKQKLQTKNADFIVLNSMRDEGATFGYDTNKVTVFDRHNNEYESPLASKIDIAKFILDVVSKNDKK